MSEILHNLGDAKLPERGCPLPYPKGQSFGDLLFWHVVTNGTRPDGSPNKFGRPWKKIEFASAVLRDVRTTANWFKNLNVPHHIDKIEEILFGEGGCYDEWRLELRQAAADLQTITNPNAQNLATNPEKRIKKHASISNLIGVRQNSFIDAIERQIFDETRLSILNMMEDNRLNKIQKMFLRNEIDNTLLSETSKFWQEATQNEQTKKVFKRLIETRKTAIFKRFDKAHRLAL